MSSPASAFSTAASASAYHGSPDLRASAAHHCSSLSSRPTTYSPSVSRIRYANPLGLSSRVQRGQAARGRAPTVRPAWCISTVMNGLKWWRSRAPGRGVAARRPWGAALVTAGLAGAALLLASLLHLGVAAAAVAILATVPTGFLAWKALPGPMKKRAFGRLTSQWTPGELGVHPVIGGSPGGPMPAYVPRRHDELLRAVLDPAVAASRLVVVRGGSSTGKTRAAYQAVTDRRFADWQLDDPQTPDLLAVRLSAGIPARTVLWLGELRQYADADGGPAVLGGLADLLNEEGHVLITTVWPQHWDTYTAAARAGPDAAGPLGVVGRLLERLPELNGRDPARINPAHGGVIDVPPQFTETDLQVAARSGDPVLADAAAAAARAGQPRQLTQYLAGVPDLLHRYDGPGGNPYGQAVITAAMDATRLGHASPLSAALLQDAAVGYLTGPERTTLIATWREPALAWATDELRGAVRALQPMPPPSGTGVVGYRVADYLDQHGRRTREDQLGPASLWDAVAAHVSSASDLTRLAQAASDRGMWRRAAALRTTAAVLGSADAASELITHLRRVSPGDTTRAAIWAARHASLDDPRAIAVLLSTLRGAGADDAVRALLARDPAAHARLDNPREVSVLLRELHGSVADNAVDTLATRSAAHTHLDDPRAIAELLMVLRGAGADDAVRALLARDPAAHARLNDLGAVHWLLRELHEAGDDGAVHTLATRSAAHARLDDSRAIAELLQDLRNAGAGDVARSLATRAASRASLEVAQPVAMLLRAMREVGADDAVGTLLARDPAAHADLNHERAIAELLKELREAGAADAVHTMVTRATGRLDDPLAVGILLWALHEVGADDAVHILLARDPAAHARLDNPGTIAGLLQVLREVGADDAVQTLLARDPAAHARLDNASAVVSLLRVLREAGADDAVRALLARDPAAHARFNDADNAANLLRALREAGASEAVHTVAARAAHVHLDNPHLVDTLLQELHAAGADDAAATLTARTANGAMFDLFLKTKPDEAPKYRFGREPDGAPSQPWNWQEPASRNRGLRT